MLDYSCQGCGSHAFPYPYADERISQTYRACYRCGLVSVENPVTTAVYNQEYVAERYDKYPTNNLMSRLRLEFIHNVLRLYESLPLGDGGVEQGRMLDVGYGNGEFIRTARRAGWDCYGNDVNPAPYPRVRNIPLPTGEMPSSDCYRVITFFDCLEHFETLDQVRQVARNTDWIFVSVPRPPRSFERQLGDPRFDWKHLRPGEHHHFFQPETLERIFTLPGVEAELVHRSSFEDAIRGPMPGGQPNIMSCALRCRRTEA